MKKLTSLILATVLLLSLSLPAFAGTQISSPGEVAVEISTTTTPEYTISFPADMKIPWEATSYIIGQVIAEKMLVEPNHSVLVEVTSFNDFNLVHESETQSKMSYTLLADGVASNAFRFGPGETGKSVPLTVQIPKNTWAVAAAGRYEDRLTFAVTYGEA